VVFWIITDSFPKAIRQEIFLQQASDFHQTQDIKFRLFLFSLQ
jgi:hypothetical protein